MVGNTVNDRIGNFWVNVKTCGEKMDRKRPEKCTHLFSSILDMKFKFQWKMYAQFLEKIFDIVEKYQKYYTFSCVNLSTKLAVD